MVSEDIEFSPRAIFLPKTDVFSKLNEINSKFSVTFFQEICVDLVMSTYFRHYFRNT